MAHWIKPNSAEIETNDLPDTIEYCESLDWKRVGDDEAESQDKISKKSTIDGKKPSKQAKG
ncbi:MAG: hypothetical protein COA96_10405 [SAR86 cluster bacterium]|uniref:Uncharacterized protein n=1 Tax=SAR86 cluster bacterium TaxID=2030880 RepID=A0A2A5AZB5_9GAMM|nr:MAG: hypothetical protein COA96_10405 [SAR86 cluster bacterium]